jgi:ubiquinone biosynthesis protein COQ4
MAMSETLTAPRVSQGLSTEPTASPTTATAPTGAVRNPRRYARPRRRWLTAAMALRRLMRDKEDTGQVFEIMGALNGPTTARNFERLMASPGGGKLAWEHVELAPKLMDAAWLDAFAPGTVGAAYRDFVRSEQLSAEGLASSSRERRGAAVDETHPYAWFGRRIRDAHDIWHVLSGYHRDGLGEACLVAFSYGQTGSMGWAVIALGAALRARKRAGHPYAKAIWQGYQRGKAAAWLPGEDSVALLAEPLEAARQRLGITPPTIYDAIPTGARDVAVPAG